MPFLGRLAMLLGLALLLLVLLVWSVRAETGIASWYGPGFVGRRMACGGRMDPKALTAAHRTLRCGTRVRVSLGRRSVVVRINDRGPFRRGRVIDLTAAGRRAIGMGGTAKVRLEVLPAGRISSKSSDLGEFDQAWFGMVRALNGLE